MPYAWAAVALNVLAFVLFIVPAHAPQLDARSTSAAWRPTPGCYIDKGMGLIIPGLTPDTLGEIYEYYPTLIELRVAAGVFASASCVHADAEGGGADLARRVPGGGRREAGS